MSITIFRIYLLAIVFMISASTGQAQASGDSVPERGPESTNKAQPTGKRIMLTDGTSMIVDEAWRKGSEVWYRRGGVSQILTAGVKSIEPLTVSVQEQKLSSSTNEKLTVPPVPPIWISLVGGIRFEVDKVNETATGAWYSRGGISVFVDRERIERIERGEPSVTTATGVRTATGRGGDWTSGNGRIDELIRVNAARYGVDPYLVFLVIEQESHFRPRALSPKGARGLMQLMPGTARRFGVQQPFDPAENIKGGTQYLRDLMKMFGGQVNLVLAGYNAGEGVCDEIRSTRASL